MSLRRNRRWGDFADPTRPRLHGVIEQLNERIAARTETTWATVSERRGTVRRGSRLSRIYRDIRLALAWNLRAP